ncbi:MAG: hypothetical protein A2Y33_09340 [Spirochaetes bacterium GWF1_51_8]|nr:MAG: hypothetical protein A2Y33_09340 [Spirochaetes bacterium GWF1_51_8]
MSIQLAYALFKKVSGKLKIEIYAEVENLGFEKRVCIKNPVTGAEYCLAGYAGFTGDNQECWHAVFEIGDVPPNGLPFVIEYRNGSDVFIDDNNGSYYLISNDMPEIMIQSGAIYLIDASINGAVFSGRIGIRKSGEISEVKVFFTTDKWQSVQETAAVFSHDLPAQFGASIYTFTVRIKDLKNADFIHFYLSCMIGSETYWGNNFSRDYILKVKP